MVEKSGDSNPRVVFLLKGGASSPKVGGDNTSSAVEFAGNPCGLEGKWDISPTKSHQTNQGKLMNGARQRFGLAGRVVIHPKETTSAQKHGRGHSGAERSGIPLAFVLFSSGGFR